MLRIPSPRPSGSHRHQRGLATLFVAIMILVVLTVVVLFAANIGLFEQKTATNENRGRLVEQAAEYAANLGGEYIKANRSSVIKKTTGGWLAADVASGKRWFRCWDVMNQTNAAVSGVASGDVANLSDGSVHPCMADLDKTASVQYPNPATAATSGVPGGRRAYLYFYSTDGTSGVNQTEVPYRNLLPTTAKLDDASVGVGGITSTTRFTTSTAVRALLCRFDSSVTPASCRTTVVSGNRIAVSLIADASLPNESSNATVKETWATYSSYTATAAVPIIGAGIFDGNGDITIVTAPNAGGYGLPGSIWTPADAQVEDTTGGGTFSLTSCYIGDYMSGSPGEHDIAEAKASCPQTGVSPPCHCPKSKDDPVSWLSGHPQGGDRRENIDILDRDGGACNVSKGNPCPPDIQFFPGAGPTDPTNPASADLRLDVDGVFNDDSLFEWIFGVDYVVADGDVKGITLGTNSTTCSKGGNCFDYAMLNDVGLDVATHKLLNCSTLGPGSSGLYYITGNCNIPGTVGSKDAPVVLVITGDGDIGPNAVIYGMFFIHKDNIYAQKHDSGFTLFWQGGTVFGSIVVEGDIKVAGNAHVVYDDTSLNNDPNTLPPSATFARVPGSWLDSRNGF